MIAPAVHRCGAALAVALTLSPGACLAADAEGRYAVEGPGRQFCSDFAALGPDSREYAISVGYASGYLNALNAYLPETYDLTPWQTLELAVTQLRRFCDANPEAPLARALAEYARFLQDDRITKEEQKLSLQVGEEVVFLYPSTLQKIRTALAELGFGTTDEPLSGLRDYQSSIGLEPTGLPDQATLSQLLNARG